MAARIVLFLLPVMLAAVSWILLGLLGVVMEAPVQASSRWIVETGGPWAGVAFMVALPTICYTAMYILHRRDKARQYAADRTIHVERHWTPERKRLVFWTSIPAVLVLAKLVYDALAG